MSRLHRILRAAPNQTPATLQPGHNHRIGIGPGYYGDGYFAGRTRRIHLEADPPPSDPIPGPWLVRLLLADSLLPIRAVWSDPVTGNYQFNWIQRNREYLILSQDHTRQFNAEVLDRITALSYVS